MDQEPTSDALDMQQWAADGRDDVMAAILKPWRQI